MVNHVLSLEVPTVMNGCIMNIMDTSVYSSLIPITCPTLQVTIPGFTHPVKLDFTPSSLFTITACDLELQTEDCGTSYVDIPDGVYILKYSVSPNTIVYVEYNHLRITKALQKYHSALCEIDLADCDPPAKVKETLNKLRLIKMYLEAAKAKVETCHEPVKGMTIYNYAVKLLDKINCTNC
jgi:hypothetical protein